MNVLHPLRSVRQQQNLTIAQLAQRANVSSTTIWRVEHGHAVNAESRRRLCAFFSMTSRELGLVATEAQHIPAHQEPGDNAFTTTPPPTIPQTNKQATQRTAAVRKQQVGKWLVRLTGDLAELYNLDWSLVDSLQVVLQSLQRLPLPAREMLVDLPSTASVDVVSAGLSDQLAQVDHDLLYETLMFSIADSWQMFHTLPPTRVLIAAQAQLYVVHELRAAIPKTSHQSLEACLYNLIGGSFFFKGQYLAAQQAHERAFLAAADVADRWNMAQSLSWQSIVASKFGRYTEAMQSLESSLHLVDHESDEQHLRLRAHLLADWAFNASLHADHRLALDKLHDSAILLEGLGPSEEFDLAQWHEIAGNCALNQGQYSAAITHFEAALALLPAVWMSRRVLTLIPLARAYALHHEREGSISAGRHATTLLQTLQSPMLSECFMIYLHILHGAYPHDSFIRSFITSSQQMLDLQSTV